MDCNSHGGGGRSNLVTKRQWLRTRFCFSGELQGELATSFSSLLGPRRVDRVGCLPGLPTPVCCVGRLACAMGNRVGGFPSLVANGMAGSLAWQHDGQVCQPTCPRHT